MEPKKDKESPLSNHILTTSSNLMTLCFALLGFLKTSNSSQKTLLDETLLIPITLFFCASLFSYLAMRNNQPRSEKIADACFIVGLSSLAVLSLVVMFKVI